MGWSRRKRRSELPGTVPPPDPATVAERALRAAEEAAEQRSREEQQRAQARLKREENLRAKAAAAVEQEIGLRTDPGNWTVTWTASYQDDYGKDVTPSPYATTVVEGVGLRAEEAISKTPGSMLVWIDGGRLLTFETFGEALRMLKLRRS